MVHRELWRAAGFQRTDRVCMHCLERCIGRKTTLNDITECGLNIPFFLGAQMANPTPEIAAVIERIQKDIHPDKYGALLLQYRGREPIL